MNCIRGQESVERRDWTLDSIVQSKPRPHAKHAVFIVNVLESKEIEKYFFLTKSNLSKIGTRAKQCNIPYKHKKLRIILRKWLTTQLRNVKMGFHGNCSHLGTIYANKLYGCINTAAETKFLGPKKQTFDCLQTMPCLYKTMF